VTAKRRRVRAKATSTKLTVLLVDDDALTRSQLSRRLEREGFKVRSCPSFDEALAIFRAGQMDAVIADWDLEHDTRKRGDALFEEIRKRDWEVPLVLVSGKLDEANQKATTLDHLLDCGAVQFVERGESYDPIVKALWELLARRDVALSGLLRKIRRMKATVATTSGRIGSEEVLKSLLDDMRWKGGTLSPLAKEFAQWELEKRKKGRSL
jgi:DNA-binding NtrC family response regulator